jgi:hypothetical protein
VLIQGLAAERAVPGNLENPAPRGPRKEAKP